ncbi:tryptophan 7-halogenase [Chitinibacter sp. SCUT-21]|uniref:NAD(P)/FAD-dependent oxidoreductase n=1 Tax=Chitinibacter sp. SCUT-21 TaxID=2970891 RepID=UPI0035A57A35
MNYESDVLIIGAGPSGAVAGALLNKQGFKVRILERQTFPRFSIGESLLAHCLDFLAEADMLRAVHQAGFQYKNGAAFAHDGKYSEYNFGDTFTAGYPYTFQVQRAPFDKLLADEAERQGVEILYQHEIIAADFSNENPLLTAKNAAGEVATYSARFVLDASGFGRTLPRLLDLELPSDFPVRRAVFTHIDDNIVAGEFDRQKIRVTVHPTKPDIWFWTIPFSNGRSSQGAVASAERFAAYPGTPEQQLKALIAETPCLAQLLRNAEWDTPVNELNGYAANVKAMHGKGFALLGNAAEFLDPVFSSGVTIAMRSASMAAKVLTRQLNGESVDWENEFAQPLKRGVDTFRTYVTGWYDGRFQSVIFSPDQQPQVKAMVCSILAGYAWDEKNPFVAQSERRLQTLFELCSA